MLNGVNCRQVTLLNIEDIGKPQRCEIWRVDFDPTIGSEMRKIQPAVVISSNGIGRLPIRLVVPITEWKGYFAGNFWHIPLEPNTMNGLVKYSAIDVL